MSTVAEQVDSLDTTLFSSLETGTTGEWDRRALLSLHAATAHTFGTIAYLEIGSYLGGSLQAVMRDPRCRKVISIDKRPPTSPDVRGTIGYDDNTTEHMLELLRQLPGVDMGKLVTLEAGTDKLRASTLPVKPDYCFIDAEHTYEAVLRDARFCAEAICGVGVIAFHDYHLLGSAISTFVRENWRDISFALAFSAPVDPLRGLGVFALEMGGRGVLKQPVIGRAVASRWHQGVWNFANRQRRTALPFLIACASVPAIDSFVVLLRHGFQEFVKR